MEFTPDEYAMMRQAATQDLLTGLDLGTLPEALAVDMVLYHGVNVRAVQHGTGLTALHLAAALGMVRLVGALIDAGADVTALSPANTTPLGALALIYVGTNSTGLSPASRMIVRRLIAAGADWREIPRMARQPLFDQELAWMGKLSRSTSNNG